MSDQNNLEDNIKSFNNWEDLNLRDDVLRGIFSYGLESPSTIQQKAIAPIIEGRDVIGQAQSGTGKTATFCIGTLSKINYELDFTQVIIICPTRELASQINEVLSNLGNFVKKLSCKLLVGGGSITDDIRDLKLNPKVIIGTPGRICDMIRRKFLLTNYLKLVIMDEADELFSNGFIEQIMNMFDQFNKVPQVGIFSATLPTNIHFLINKITNNPVNILVKPECLTLEGIKQFFIPVDDDKMKFDTLIDIYSAISLTQSIIYCNSVKRVKDLQLSLEYQNFYVSVIHSMMTNEERKKSFNEFKKGKSRILISTDITARGIDIQQVGLVINMDLPIDIHKYIHRIGRSGRWGRKGMAINFISRRDIFKIKEIEKYYHTNIEALPEDFSKYI